MFIIASHLLKWPIVPFNYVNGIVSANPWVRVACQPLTSEESHQQMEISVLYLGGDPGPVSDAHGKDFLLRMLGGGPYKVTSPLEQSPLSVCRLRIVTTSPAYPRVTAPGQGGPTSWFENTSCVWRGASHLEQ